MKKRLRKYKCPACGKILLRMAATKTYKSYCEKADRSVRIRLVEKKR